MISCVFASGCGDNHRVACSNRSFIHTPTLPIEFCNASCFRREEPRVGFFAATSQLAKTQSAKPAKKKKCGTCKSKKASSSPKANLQPVPQIAGTNTYTPPPKPETLQFVWTYIDGPAALDELRFSIRSVLNNYQGKAEILVVGGRPSWYTGSYLHRKRDTRGSGFKKGLSDVQSKMDFISTCDQVSDTFVWMMDDVFMVKPTTYEQLSVPRASGFVSASARNGWQTVKTNTARQLAKQGYSTHDYATHLPHLTEKTNLQRVFQAVDRRKHYYLWEVMYWNILKVIPERHTPFLRRINKPVHDYSEIAKKAHFINVGGKSWSSRFRDWLWDQFPDFSPYETGIIHAKGSS